MHFYDKYVGVGGRKFELELEWERKRVRVWSWSWRKWNGYSRKAFQSVTICNHLVKEGEGLGVASPSLELAGTDGALPRTPGLSGGKQL